MIYSSTSQIKYKHFIRYNQSCFDGIEYGYIDLYYEQTQSALFILKVDPRLHTARVMEFPLKTADATPEVILEDFLINLMSYKENFEGNPLYVQSEMFSEAEFNNMLIKAMNLMDEREKLVFLTRTSNELIEYCKSIHITLQQSGSNPDSWQAICMSGGSHYMMVSSKTNQWGCGYCKKGGDINALKEWYAIKLARKLNR